MEAIFGFLILIADIYAIIKILQSSADGLKKVLWILLVLILPLIGLIIWYFAGPGGKGG
ncbi:PLDc N-terminal domain-containing protein [Microbulbifer yueqingensis]|uniref:Phospholipase_D-nuclease N-terminal n=1 Tax=Microbulbifer yueqingensis TaxID=658219 RepID=A0A1G8UEM9_9GAMM|nr:PLDc N-terminal domain-containing protein [Microbulbifer yueqingensis]SDJ52199.1 Phospholipase_D-nuclease N-terminal [Microbulbifer yueqingensis]